MWPPRLNGAIASSSSARAPQRADPARPAHLVRREREEVAAERLHVDRAVRRGLRRVDDHDRAVLVRPRGQLLDGVDRAERVRDEVVRDDLDVALAAISSSASSWSSPASSIGITRKLGAGPLGDVLPGDEVRVVLELGDDDEVARAEVVEPPGVGDEVERLGRAAREDDLARRRRVDERAHLLAGALVAGGRALGELVDAAVHVRVRGLVEVAHARRAPAAASACWTAESR